MDSSKMAVSAITAVHNKNSIIRKNLLRQNAQVGLSTQDTQSIQHFWCCVFKL